MEEAINRWLDIIETITDQIDYNYIVSNVEESKYNDDTYEQFGCDVFKELAKRGEQIKAIGEMSGMLIEIED